MSQAKPFSISKKIVWEAYERVKANQGAAGVDAESNRGVRARSEEQPLQDLESHVVGDVLPAASAHGGDTEERRRREAIGHSDRRGQDCSDGGQNVFGASWWNRPSIQTPMAIGLGSLRSMLSPVRGSDAGAMPGSLTSTSAASSIISTTNWCFGRCRKYTQCRGFSSTTSGGSKRPPNWRMEHWCRERRGRRRAEWSVLWWPTCFCTSRLTTGCGVCIRPCHSRGTQMILSRTAGRRRRRSRSWRASDVVSRSVDWRCILRRRASSTARMTTGRAGIPRNGSISWGTRFALGGRRIDGASSSSTSLRR